MKTLVLIFALVASPVFAAWDGATIKSIDAQPNGQVHVGVVITDSGSGQATFQDFQFDGAVLSAASLAAAVQARVTSLNAAGATSKALTPGASISLTPAVAVQPTPPAPPTAEQQFFLDLQQLSAVQRGLTVAGFDPMTSTDYKNLLAKVQQEFVSSYVNDGGWPR